MTRCSERSLLRFIVGCSLGFAILFGTSGQSAPLPEAAVDKAVLREVLCNLETGTCGPKNKKCPNRAWAFDTKSWSSVGFCQIHLSNAFDAGYSKTKDPALLFQRKESEKLADDFLVKVEAFLIRKGARANVYNMAFKYNCGINRKIEQVGAKKWTEKGQRCAEYAARAVEEYDKRVKP